MQTKNKMITGIITGFTLLAFTGGVSAAIMTAEDLEAQKAARDARIVEIEANRADKQEEVEIKKDERQAEIDAKREEIKEKRCEQVKSRVQSRISNFEENNSYHQKNFNLINKNIDELIELFKTEGIDTADLEGYLAVLEAKLTNLYEDHEAFITALNASEEVACDDIEKGVEEKLQFARQEGQVIREDVNDIKDYYKETIRPELLELKQEYLEVNEDELEEK